MVIGLGSELRIFKYHENQSLEYLKKLRIIGLGSEFTMFKDTEN